MNTKQAKETIDKYNQGKGTARENSLLENWYLQESQRHPLSEKDYDFLHLKEDIWNGVKDRAGIKHSPVAGRLRIWPAVAAAIFMVIGFGTYFYLENTPSRLRKASLANHIVPGGNRATLTLGDGSTLSLTDAGNGTLAMQSGTEVKKSAGGQLVYEASKTGAEPVYNTLATPRGGQYQLVLADGTKVWLNASSALRFPAIFNGGERRVELKGEAYFEVAKNAKMPFIVISKNQATKVLGTHFNVNAYPDEEAVVTTLLEGKVAVAKLNAEQEGILAPGQQSSMGNNGDFRIGSVNPGQFVAWKGGKFIFAQADIESIMRQVSRWYNVDVVYKGRVSKQKFGGQASRFANMGELLEILELTGNVKFEIEGRRIIVMS